MTTDSPSESEGWEAKPPFMSKINCNVPAITYMEWGGSMNIMSGMNQGGVCILS